MNGQGFSLLEGLLALAILGVILASLLPGFFGYMDVTTRNEERSGAIAAARQQMEAARRLDPASMPTSGSAGPSYLLVDGREYEVLTRYCNQSRFCTTNSRHLRIEVSYGGETVYSTETVYTKLR